MNMESLDNDDGKILRGDPQQEAAWIAFSRVEWFENISEAFPKLSHRLGYATDACFHNAMATALEVLPGSFASTLKDIELLPTMSSRELFAAYALRRRDYQAFSALDTKIISDHCAIVLPSNSPVHTYALFHRTSRMAREGQPHLALIELNEVRSNLVKHSSEVLQIWQDTLLSLIHGTAAAQDGDFKSGQEQLETALRHSNGLRFALTGTIEFRIAQLYRESGQPDRAMEIWSCQKRISSLKKAHQWANLSSYHLNAASCALDEKDTPRARKEAQQAKQLQPYIQEHYPRLIGYQYLREGEICTQEENYEDGERLLRQAIDHFAGMDIVCEEGLLEAKLSLGSYALLQNDPAMAWAIIRSLIDESESRGCLHLRSRALLLQTWFFISDDPPAVDAYNNILERVHLIQNPSLLLHALGNLLTYAVEHLSEDEPDLILEKIASLKSRLSDSCYEKLFEKHVLNRFGGRVGEELEEQN
ncbi:MAG: hypothetical protein GWP41_09945 [Planctomycetia bacterium]|jgi:tetratricopeptide (TPR) repeat protein|nr:hypothetical protein [Planctomycetia bacterium]NCF98076.1 hypothetical protein [Planctomycetia bacterium]NCG13824.1 hypothetical protein [Planctomycetia bacterium]NCG56428.1 hypothetical protein [Pseudomonadota bacterium]